MKVCILSTQDCGGGAFNMASDLHRGFEWLGVDSHLLVQKKNGADEGVIGPSGFRVLKSRLYWILEGVMKRLLTSFYGTEHKIYHSLGLLSSFSMGDFERYGADLVHLHWICDGYLSLESIGRIRKPVVWTLHDMWAFCGAEHHSRDERYRFGYDFGNRPLWEWGWDLNRWVWRRKVKAFELIEDLTVVCPSRWLFGCARESIIFKERRIEVIPNGVDGDIFKRRGRSECLSRYGLSKDWRYIIFGARHGLKDENKGFKFFKECLEGIRGVLDRLGVLVFGISEEEGEELSLPVRYLGDIQRLDLGWVYGCGEVMVVPSKIEVFAYTVLESLGCGVPVVGFNIGGLRDMIEHRKNGYLAKPYDIEDLVYGVRWVLEDDVRWKKLSDRSLEKVSEEFSLEKEVKSYQSLYEKILDQKKRRS